MTQTSFPFDAGAGANVYEEGWTQMASLWVTSGIIPDLLSEYEAVANNLAPRAVYINPGVAWITGIYGQSDAQEQIAIAAPDATNPRIDRIVLRLDRAANTILLVLLQGTPAGSPTVPSLTQTTGVNGVWDIPIVQVRVNPGSVFVALADLTDERVFATPLPHDHMGTGHTGTAQPNTVQAGPASGSAGAWVARQLVAADMGVDQPRYNHLTNPGFEIWQRGAGAFSANGFCADRWELGVSGTFSAARNTANADAGSEYCAVLTAAGISSTCFLLQRLKESHEYRALSARVVSFSVRVLASVATAIRAFIWSTTTGYTYSAYHTGSGVYRTLTVTATVNANATEIQVGLEVGLNGTYYVDNACLVLGSVAADYSPLTPADDLARCQRYYEVHGAPASGLGNPVLRSAAGGANAFGQTVPFAVTKGGTPTVTKNGTWAATLCGQPSIDVVDRNAYSIFATATGAGAAVTNPNSADDSVTAEYNP